MTSFCTSSSTFSQIARFMRPKSGSSGADRTQVGPMLATRTLLSWLACGIYSVQAHFYMFNLSCTNSLILEMCKLSYSSSLTFGYVQSILYKLVDFLGCSINHIEAHWLVCLIYLYKFIQKLSVYPAQPHCHLGNIQCILYKLIVFWWCSTYPVKVIH